DTELDEIICKIDARYLDNKPVTIQKSFKPTKGNTQMDTVDVDEAKIAESHIKQVTARYRTLQNLLKSEEDPVAKAGRQGVAIVDLIIKSQPARLRREDPSLTPEQAYTKAYLAPENAVLRRAENNARHAAIGSSYRISEPIYKVETSGADIYKR